MKLPTLAYRQTLGDMIEVYKQLQGKYDSDISNTVKLHKDSNTKERTRGHSLKLSRMCSLEKNASHFELQNYGMIYQK